MTDTTAVVEFLRETRDRIATPDRWTKGADARNKNGMPTWSGDPGACQWCLVGAGAATSGAYWWTMARETLLPAVRRCGYQGLSDFNDAPTTTHADVLALFDEAIRAEEAKLP